MHGSAAIFGRPGERRSLGLWLRREICGGRRALSVDPGPARWRADLDWPLATPRSKDTSPVQINVKAATPALLGERRGWRRCWLEWCALRPPRSSAPHLQAPAPIASGSDLASQLACQRRAARRCGAHVRPRALTNARTLPAQIVTVRRPPSAQLRARRRLAPLRVSDARPRTKQRTALAAARGDAAVARSTIET